jgi:acyl-CoA thioesterase-2
MSAGEDAPASMVDRLALARLEADVFESVGVSRQRHLFGGLLLGQATYAALLTVPPDRPARALHASFVVAGNGTQPVRYEVERTRDGRSFSTRRVVARQSHRVLLVATVDVQAGEGGPEYERAAPADVPPPEGLRVGRYDSRWFESRDVRPTRSGAVPSPRRAWFKAQVSLPADPVLHQAALAYLSDHGPTRAVREPHAGHPGMERRMSASLDHAVWFHRAGAVDQWLLYELTPMSTSNGRGLALGTIRDRAGGLLATVAQEALLRLPG